MKYTSNQGFQNESLEDLTIPVNRQLYAGIPDLSDSRIKQIAKLNIFGSIVIALNAVGWAFVWIIFDRLVLFFVCFAYLLYAYWIFKTNQKGRYYQAFGWMITGMVVWIALLGVVVSGPGLGYGGSVHGFFLTLAMAVFILLKPSSLFLRISITMSMVLLFLCFHLPVVNFTPMLPLPYEQHIMATKVTWISVVITTLGLYLWLFKTDVAYDRRIKFTDQRLQNLFTDFLPHRGNAQGQLKGNIVASAIPECSVLFVELANLGELRDSYNEEALLAMLNSLFGKFDDTVYDADLDKIKTFEFSYMVASGVSKFDELHAQKLVDLALDFITISNSFNDVHIRIGVHSGAATAGLIKDSAFVYTLWGESVNIASMLERFGDPSRVNISESTYQAVGHLFSCEHNRNLMIKELGRVNMYHVQSI